MCENEASVVCYFRTTCYDKNHVYEELCIRNNFKMFSQNLY